MAWVEACWPLLPYLFVLLMLPLLIYILHCIFSPTLPKAEVANRPRVYINNIFLQLGRKHTHWHQWLSRIDPCTLVSTMREKANTFLLFK